MAFAEIWVDAPDLGLLANESLAKEFAVVRIFVGSFEEVRAAVRGFKAALARFYAMAFAEIVVHGEIRVFTGSPPQLFMDMTDNLPERLAFSHECVLRLFMKPDFLARLGSA